MTRTQIINHFIKTRNYSHYLEIGIWICDNYNKVNIPFKIGVDPEPHCNNLPGVGDIIFKKTSDEFFKTYKGQHFDIIFIDGLHLKEQVIKDIENSMKILAPGGVILVHDCNPPTEKHAVRERTMEIAAWNGDVYLAVGQFRSSHSLEWKFTCVDTDWGIGIIERRQTPLKQVSPQAYERCGEDKSKWTCFDENRHEWLNLITVDQFLKEYK